ncbi:MAG: helix-turn-helix transcriptional regulator [Candidatus Gastranaerophilales bacterium]
MSSINLYKRLGNNIRKQRKLKKITIERLAELANINECFLGEMERGRKKPSIDTLIILSNSLNIDVSLLFVQ